MKTTAADEDEASETAPLTGLHGDSVYADGDVARADASGSPREDAANILRLAWPMGLSYTLSNVGMQCCAMFAGRMGATELGAVTLGNMWCNITGYSIQFGGLTALDTLAAQSFGAQNFRLVGIHLQRALLIIGLMCLPISAMWWFATAPVLEMLRIQPETIALTQLYARAQIACLPPLLATTATQQFLQAQGIVKPYTVTIAALVPPSVFVYWLFIRQFELGFSGALLAQVCNAWATFLSLLVVVRWRGLHRQCWHSWSREALTGWGEMLRLGAAGTVHQMAECVRLRPKSTPLVAVFDRWLAC
jgi:MATE family multidrug resistance protein